MSWLVWPVFSLPSQLEVPDQPTFRFTPIAEPKEPNEPLQYKCIQILTPLPTLESQTSDKIYKLLSLNVHNVVFVLNTPTAEPKELAKRSDEP